MTTKIELTSNDLDKQNPLVYKIPSDLATYYLPIDPMKVYEIEIIADNGEFILNSSLTTNSDNIFSQAQPITNGSKSYIVTLSDKINITRTKKDSLIYLKIIS